MFWADILLFSEKDILENLILIFYKNTILSKRIWHIIMFDIFRKRLDEVDL